MARRKSAEPVLTHKQRSRQSAQPIKARGFSAAKEFRHGANVEAKGMDWQDCIGIIAIGAVLALLTLGGLVALLSKVDDAKGIWSAITPILLTGFGLLGGKRLEK